MAAVDDLVLTPLDNMTKKQRRAECLQSQDSLTRRIKEYAPLAIVSLLPSIDDIVGAAALAAGHKCRPFVVPFAGNGQQTRFQKAMTQIVPLLPRETGLKG